VTIEPASRYEGNAEGGRSSSAFNYINTELQVLCKQRSSMVVHIQRQRQLQWGGRRGNVTLQNFIAAWQSWGHNGEVPDFPSQQIS